MAGRHEEYEFCSPVPRRVLGRTGLVVSRLALGAGPVSGLMTGDAAASQADTLQALYEFGINWIDTAAGYGNGSSETNIGRALAELPSDVSEMFHVATKVRIDFRSSRKFADQVLFGLDASLSRLQRSKVTLLQLHNGVTVRQGDQPNSLAVADVLNSGGILDALKSAQADGRVNFLGLTGTGVAEQLRAVVRSREFDTIQVPYNLLNSSAGCETTGCSQEQNYGNILEDCHSVGMGCFAIRVFAGGALLGQPPSKHTLKTPFFPLDLYQRDLERAARISNRSSGSDLKQRSVKFALSHPAIHSAIIGFGAPEHVRDTVRALSGVPWL